jgi:hypothetical protein
VATIKSYPKHNATGADSDTRTGISTGSPLTSPNKPTNAAIVAPFNYNPNQKCFNSNADQTISQDNESCPPSKHLTKTEMLIARRQSYLNSLNNSNKDNENNEETEGKRSACLVTTV